jgi:branched-chain amino acid transport system substrate-binding protein
VEAALRRGMSKNPQERPRTALEFAQEFALAAVSPVQPGPATGTQFAAPSQGLAGPGPGPMIHQPPSGAMFQQAGPPSSGSIPLGQQAGGSGSGRSSLWIASALVLALALGGLVYWHPWATAGPVVKPTATASGSGKPTVIQPLTIATDLELQGANKALSTGINQALELYLSQVGHKAGAFDVQLRPYDSTLGPDGNADNIQCGKNANQHLQKADEVAVVGPLFSNCTRAELPVLNNSKTGDMLTVAFSNSYPGLTKSWDTGEPDKFIPSGRRNFARVVPDDGQQGPGAAQFIASELRIDNVFVLHDSSVYGLGVASSFKRAAAAQNVKVVGDLAWDPQATSFRGLFNQVKASGAKVIFLSGVDVAVGMQLMRDKVAVLGDNTKIQVVTTDAFGDQEFDNLPQAADVFVTYPGTTGTQLRQRSTISANFLDAYKKQFGDKIDFYYVMYSVAALQVVLAAIERSDGTRQSVRDQVFTGDGIEVPSNKCVLGQRIRISPTTGDITPGDLAIALVQDKSEHVVRTMLVE